jgi:hypothetical protein
MFLLYVTILLIKQIKVEKEGKHESIKFNKKLHHNSKNSLKVSLKAIGAITCDGSQTNTPDVCQAKFAAVRPVITLTTADDATKEGAIQDFINACGAAACKTICSSILTGTEGSAMNDVFLASFEEKCDPSEATTSSSTEGSDEADDSNSPSSEGKNEGGKPDEGNSTKRVTIFLLLISMMMSNILI